MSEDNRLAARSALKAAQAGLAEGLNRLMVATTARAGSGGAADGGESLPAFSGGAGAFRSPADSFLPGGFGAQGRGEGSGGSRTMSSRTILPSVDFVGGSYILPILPDYENRITTPLTVDMGGGARGQGGLTHNEAYASSHGGGYADDDGSQGERSSRSLDIPRSNSQGEGGGGNPPSYFRISRAGSGGQGEGSIRGSGRFGTVSTSFRLYGPHGASTGICGGIIARGLQGQFPDRFCLKTRCSFASHSVKSHLGRLEAGAYYVKENESHGYAEVCLPANAAALAPEGLLESTNNVAGWKAIIRQLIDQLAAGEVAPAEAAAMGAGLSEFADRVLKTPYAITPMRASRRKVRMSDDDSDGGVSEGGGLDGPAPIVGPSTLQRLEDSIGLLRGELGVCAQGARYLTLHGGVGALGEDVERLGHEVSSLAKNLELTARELVGVRAEGRDTRAVAETLHHEAQEHRRATPTSHSVEAIRRELQLAKAERGELEATVLTLTSAVTGLMQSVAAGVGPGSSSHGGVDLPALELRLKAQEEAVNGRLDSIRQEMKGGGVKIGGVNFTGKEAAMGWARLHLPPGSYQCIGGMVYAMCLISEAVVHQEDMMKREEHGERVKRTFMQSAQVLSVHTSYPPVLDGAKGASKRDSSVDFLELRTYKQWKPTDGDGTLRKLEEGVERSFDLIDNAIESTFAMKPLARTVLLELVREFKSLFHGLFVMEVNRFYEDTLNKVGGEHPSEPATGGVPGGFDERSEREGGKGTPRSTA